jgi:hypothetical protein
MKFFFAVTAGNLALQDRKTSREQRRALFQSSKRNADPVMFGAYAPNSCIKAPPLCATHLKKVDENFNLLAASVRAQQVKPIFRNHSAALPEKDSLYQSFRRAFFKRPRILYPR